MGDRGMSQEFGQWRYEGSWQTPIPNPLIYDKRLSANALKLWIVLRAAIEPGKTLAPTYDYLGEQCNMSRSTVARSIKLLRACRWIQTKQVTTESGWLSGSMYRMCDTPTAIADIASTDADFPVFLANCAESNDFGLRTVALVEIQEWSAAGLQPIEIGTSKISHSSSKTRLSSSKIELPALGLKLGSSKTELLGSMKFELLENLGSMKTELPEKARFSGSMKTELPRTRDVVSSCSNNRTTTNKEAGIETCAHEALVWPDVIPLEMRLKIMSRLVALPNCMAQELLDEVAFKQLAGKVSSSPVALLFSLIPIAEQGKFLITGGMNVARARARNAMPTLAESPPIDAEQQRLKDYAQYVAQMREYGVEV